MIGQSEKGSRSHGCGDQLSPILGIRQDFATLSTLPLVGFQLNIRIYEFRQHIRIDVPATDHHDIMRPRRCENSGTVRSVAHFSGLTECNVYIANETGNRIHFVYSRSMLATDGMILFYSSSLFGLIDRMVIVGSCASQSVLPPVRLLYAFIDVS